MISWLIDHWLAFAFGFAFGGPIGAFVVAACAIAGQGSDAEKGTRR